jgi:hypothetical protein
MSALCQKQPFGRHVVVSAEGPKADKPRIGPEVAEVIFLP